MNHGAFEERIGLVTGASQGLGLAVARALAEAGARVVLHGRDESALRAAHASLDGPGRHAWIQADLARPEGAAHLAGQYAALHARIDLLIHAAAVLGPRVPLADYPAERWREVLQVNLTAGFELTQALLPLLRRGQRPAVLFVASSVGRRGRAGWGAYAVSKFGVEGLVQVLAAELEPDGVRVNALNPGPARTRMRALAYPEEDPLGLPAPEELAPAFLELLHPRNTLTGQSLDARPNSLKRNN
jgi:NAD(P)-dependent dehydrogenase (short-subunit alcohol dehydrogenase family)